MGPIGYSSDEITKLAEDQMKEVDFEARRQMFQDLEYLVSEEVPLIVIANQSSTPCTARLLRRLDEDVRVSADGTDPSVLPWKDKRL